ncbi:2'-5' RNA ligase family protein [Nocardioides sp. NPDC101246]|uniref:2'-5' RNA ligase family protein n=1 Tax=Nocardioides sp. NPDC101246 TaxID=3364336 RepID=UPI00381DFFBD
MALAVCQLFDARSDRLVRELWARLEEAGVGTMASHTHGRHHPHLSFAVLRTWELGPVRDTLDGLPEGEPFRCSSHGSVIFPRGRVALAPSFPATVAMRQDRVARALLEAGADLHKHYRPGLWLPHVSVATRASAVQLPVIVNAVADVLPLELHAVRTALVDSSSGRIWRLPRML